MGTDFYDRYLKSDTDFITNIKENFNGSEIDEILYLINNYKKILIFGDVQSGKTGRIEKIRNDVFANESFDVVIIFGGTNINLSNQTRDRMNKTRTHKSNHLFLDSTGVKGLDAMSLKDDGCIVELNVKKDAYDIDNVIKFMSSIRSETKVLVIDDESDYASLNIANQKNEGSKIYSALTRIVKFENTRLCMFTATPYANIINQKENELCPEIIYKLKNPKEYTGNNFFLDHVDKVYITEFEKDGQSKERNIDSLYESIKYFIFNNALYNLRNEKRYFELLINIDLRKEAMDFYYDKISPYLKGVLFNKLNNWNMNVFKEFWKRQMFDQEIDLNDDELLVSLYKEMKSIRRYFSEGVKNIIKLYDKDNTYISPERNTMKEPHIIVSGALASRGFTFNNLLTELMINEPKGKNSADTLCQRARWFGYRADYSEYIRVITSKKILQSFYDIKTINDWIEGKMIKNVLEVNAKVKDDLIAVGRDFECTALTGGKKNVKQ
jgi:hypothetical protein